MSLNSSQGVVNNSNWFNVRRHHMDFCEWKIGFVFFYHSIILNKIFSGKHGYRVLRRKSRIRFLSDLFHTRQSCHWLNIKLFKIILRRTAVRKKN